MPVVLAETAGFCFGVNNAVDRVRELLDAGEQVCTLGPIIHNPQVVEELAARGVRIVEDPTDTPPGAVLVIRSHGVSKATLDAIQQAGIRCCNATCPFVAKIHRIVAENTSPSSLLIIVGDASHPEVIGIRSFSLGDTLIVNSPEELESVQINQNKVVVVSQTTQNSKKWEICKKFIQKLCTNRIFYGIIINK